MKDGIRIEDKKGICLDDCENDDKYQNINPIINKKSCNNNSIQV